ILQQGSENLDKAPEPFMTVAIQALEGVRERLRKMATSLHPVTNLGEKEFTGATDRAADALERFRATLQDRLPSSPKETALGRDAYVFFLKNVALYPYSPEQILAMGQQEWNRAVAFESYEKERNKNVPPLQLAKDIDSWIKDAAAKESKIREFLEKHAILTVPGWLQHYTLRTMPEYLRVLGFSENDDFTSPSRLTDNCIRYVSEPSGNLGYFWRATAQDPRPIIVHEGIPGDYLQFHAAARAPGGSGCETGAWPILVRRSCQVSRAKSPNGCPNRAAGSDRVLHRPRPGPHISDRQTPNYEIPRRCADATGR